MGLHLLGIRYKNYRNFEDVFINISSKYRTEVEDECSVLNIKVSGKEHYYKTIHIKSIKVEELDNHKKTIRYKCIVGKNGTGKTAILKSYSDKMYFYTDDIEYAKKIFYRIFIDEDTKKIYLYHDNNPIYIDFENRYEEEGYYDEEGEWCKCNYRDLFIVSDEYFYKKFNGSFKKIKESISYMVSKDEFENIENFNLFGEYAIDNETIRGTDISYLYYWKKEERESIYYKSFNLYVENNKNIKNWGIKNKNICYKIKFFDDEFENIVRNSKCFMYGENNQINTNMIMNITRDIINTIDSKEEYLKKYKKSIKNLLGYMFFENKEKNNCIKRYDAMIEPYKIDTITGETINVDFNYILEKDLENILKNTVKDFHGNNIQKEKLVEDIEDLGERYYKMMEFYNINNLEKSIRFNNSCRSYRINTIKERKFPYFFCEEIYYYFLKDNNDKDIIESFFEKASYMINKYPIFSLILSCDLENVSSGERECIERNSIISVYIDNIIKKSKKSNIILSLDEPDLYLHPEWIRKFKYYLDKTLKRKCEENKDLTFQVNIATNSPFMVSDFKKDELLMLDFKKDSDYNITEVMESKSFFGANIYDILKESFFLDSAIGESAQEEINNMIDELKNIKDKFNKDEIINNAKKLNKSIADVFIKDYISNLIMRAEYDNDIK